MFARRCRRSPRNAEDEVRANAFGSGERQYTLRIAIIAERRGIGHVDARARQIHRRVEGVPAEREGIAPLAAARELDHHFADRHDASFVLGHAALYHAALRDARKSRDGAPLIDFGAEFSASSRRNQTDRPRAADTVETRREKWRKHPWESPARVVRNCDRGSGSTTPIIRA
jgi:hypothetical protein